MLLGPGDHLFHVLPPFSDAFVAVAVAATAVADAEVVVVLVVV